MLAADSLDPALVQAARELEIDYLRKMKVYDVASRKEMKTSGQVQFIYLFRSETSAVV